MYLLHTHQPMQVPHPGPSMFLCLCSFPSNSQGFSNPSPTSPRKWDGQGTGAALFGISRVSLLQDPPPPSQSHLVH